MRRALPRLPLLLTVLGLSACAPEGPSAFVTFNIPPNTNCVFQETTELFLPIGQFDIAPGDADNCNDPYVMNLLVNSYLRANSDTMLGRAEPNILQIHSAEVHLMTVDRSTILFDRVNPPLPNPFLVTTNNSLFPSDGNSPSQGIAPVEAIPLNYASQLDGFVGQQIMAEVQIFGTTTGDIDIDFKPFLYAIEICDGCLTRCLSDLILSDIDPDDLYGDQCADNAGADGRVCIDSGC
jgi:hypothetical protein